MNKQECYVTDDFYWRKAINTIPINIWTCHYHYVVYILSNVLRMKKNRWTCYVNLRWVIFAAREINVST